jgi:MFS family permease
MSSPNPASGGIVVSTGLSADYWKFWLGQTISSLGSSFTTFALPLLIFKLTGSALNLAFATATAFLPYLLFGLLMGAWADRVDRQRLMIGTDVARAILIASVPLLGLANLLSLVWLYLVIFTTATLTIAFTAGQTSIIPSLAERSSLLKANGHLQASFSATTALGPLLAGLLITITPVYMVLFLDALSFLASAISLVLIKTDLRPTARLTPTSLGQDIVIGLRYVWQHPVLRNISLMTGVLSFFGSTVEAQIVLFATQRLHTTDTELGLLFSGGGVGILVLSLATTQISKYWSFSQVILGSAILNGLVMALLGLTSWFWLALPLWALSMGLPILFSINTLSLRQALAPNHLLGRVQTIAQVIAWSAIPLGTLLGGLVIEWTHDIALVYISIGSLNFLIALGFLFTPLSKAEEYITKQESALTPDLVSSAL